MIDFEEIRDHIVSGLHQHMSLPVVTLNPGSPRPEKPFITYNFTTPFGKGSLMPTESFNPVETEDPENPYAVEYSTKDQGRMVLSVSIINEDYDSTHLIALKAHGWFAYTGYQYLKGKEVIVSKLGDVTNRDVFIVDGFERKLGFDVTLRVGNETKYTIEPVDTLVINNEQKSIKEEE